MITVVVRKACGQAVQRREGGEMGRRKGKRRKRRKREMIGK